MDSASGNTVDSFDSSGSDTEESIPTTQFSNKEKEKYEQARKLHKFIEKIREEYKRDWTSNDKDIRQRGIALYLIDELCLRVGTKKGEKTVGCCSLLVKHIKLSNENEGHIVNFNFDGKKLIQYNNNVHVDELVYNNLKEFMQNKQQDDNLFDDKLNSKMINAYLNGYMEGLTAKVFRTYHASLLMENSLKELTKPGLLSHDKIEAFKRANLEVAIKMNHQKSIRIGQTSAQKTEQDNLLGQFEQLKLIPEDKIISTNTSKLHYIDPRIVIAWCKKFNVPFKGKGGIYTEGEWESVRWAENTEENFSFRT